jgi:hypothetical protein
MYKQGKVKTEEVCKSFCKYTRGILTTAAPSAALIMYEPKATSWTSVLTHGFLSLQLIVASPLLDWFVLIA